MRTKIGGKQILSIKQIISISLVLAWMGLIFVFSARNADLSTNDSNLVGWFIGRHFVPGFADWTEAARQEFVENIDFFVRKVAHFLEYTVLGAMVGNAARNANIGPRKEFASWLICIIYAATDEIHQYFVPGRACRLMDVAIDSAGALVGVAIFAMILTVLRHAGGRTCTRMVGW